MTVLILTIPENLTTVESLVSLDQPCKQSHTMCTTKYRAENATLNCYDISVS